MMPARAIDFSGINQAALRSNARGFLQSLILGGKFRGLEYIVKNPKRNDQGPGSFSINYRTGVWKDFASGEGGGDLISLVAYIRDIGQGEAARALANELGTQVCAPTAPPKLNGGSAHDPSSGDQIVVPIPPDAPPIPSEHFDLGKPTSIWSYHDAAGGLLGHVCRFEPPGAKKQHRPLTLHRINGQLEWRWKSWPAPRPLYGMDQLAQRPSAEVLVVEGEKAADAARKLLPDYVVVTSPNGAKAAGDADWSPLRDRDVAIWPDVDVPGEGYRDDVIGCLTDVGVKSITAITPPAGVKESLDAADALYEDGWTSERAVELIAGARTEASPATSDSPDASEPISEEEAQKEIRRLASLSVIQYEHERERVAQQLGMRASVLDDAVKLARRSTEDTKGQGRAFELPAIEPWPDPVDGVELLDETAEAIRRYIVLGVSVAETLALWVVHTHCFTCFDITPRIAITSPEKGCGKSTLLKLLGRLVNRPLKTDNATAAAIFRTIEMVAPTLLIDEANTFLKQSDDLRGVLNSGHERGGQTLRLVGDNHEPRMFATWAPLAIAMIGQLPDTLNARSIPVNMCRAKPGEKVEPLRSGRARELDVLARKIARWVKDHQGEITAKDPGMGDLNNREADNWYPLFAIAEAAGGRWPGRARELAASAERVVEEQSAKARLLQDVLWIFSGRPEIDERGKTVLLGRKVDRVSSDNLVKHLKEIDGQPWAEWNRGRGLTPDSLARLLKGFKIKPTTVRFPDRPVAKGYHFEDFRDAFSRYLPNQAVTTVTANKINDLAGIQAVTNPSDVTAQKSEKKNEINDVTAVTTCNAPIGGLEGTEGAEGEDFNEWEGEA